MEDGGSTSDRLPRRTPCRARSSRYSRVSVDQMDVERMFDLTDDQHSSSADPLSPTENWFSPTGEMTNDHRSPYDHLDKGLVF